LVIKTKCIPDQNSTIDCTFVFDTVVNTRGGELTILFDIVFLHNLRLNENVPQIWHVFLPVSTWTADSLTGELSTPVSIKLSEINENEESNELPIILNIMTCTNDSCLPLKLSVIFNIHRQTDAPTAVMEEKKLVVDIKV